MSFTRRVGESLLIEERYQITVTAASRGKAVLRIYDVVSRTLPAVFRVGADGRCQGENTDQQQIETAITIEKVLTRP